MATPPKRDINKSDQEDQKPKEEEDLENFSEELTSKMVSPTKGNISTSDQEHQKAKEEENLEASSKELTSKMATSPKETETTSDQEHQKAKEYENFVNSFKELLSKMATLLKRNINTSDQECQKAKEEKLEHYSRSKEDYEILEKLKSLVTLLLKEYQKSDDQEHQKTTEDFSKVPKGDKLAEDSLERVQDDSLAASSRQVQPPLISKLRRSLWRMYSILPPVPPAPVINEKGRCGQQTRRPRFIVSQRIPPYTCIYCRRVPRPGSRLYSKAMNTLKNLKKRLQYHGIQQEAQRCFQNHPDFYDQSNEDILPGYQTQMNSSFLINSLRQIAMAMSNGRRAAMARSNGERAATAMPSGERASTAMLNGQNYNSSEEDDYDDDDFTLICDSKSLEGPLRCPCCLEICSHTGDFLQHMKKHSSIKVCVLVKKPNFYLCPYCKQTFFSSESILAHKCLKK